MPVQQCSRRQANSRRKCFAGGDCLVIILPRRGDIYFDQVSLQTEAGPPCHRAGSRDQLTTSRVHPPHNLHSLNLRYHVLVFVPCIIRRTGFEGWALIAGLAGKCANLLNDTGSPNRFVRHRQCPPSSVGNQ